MGGAASRPTRSFGIHGQQPGQPRRSDRPPWSPPSRRRALHLPKLDQQQMLDIRSAWFDANYGPPPGNKRELRGSAPCARRPHNCSARAEAARLGQCMSMQVLALLAWT